MMLIGLNNEVHKSDLREPLSIKLCRDGIEFFGCILGLSLPTTVDDELGLVAIIVGTVATHGGGVL